MIYGYARCSTNEEMQDINRQIRELKQLGATDRTIYREYDSGMKNDRVELQRLLETVKLNFNGCWKLSNQAIRSSLPKSAESRAAQNSSAR